MSRLQELREKKAQLAKEIRSLADKVNAENRNFTAEENEKWTKVNAEYNEVAQSVEINERADLVTKDVESRRLPGNEDTDDKTTRSRKGKREQRKLQRQKGERIERAKALAFRNITRTTDAMVRDGIIEISDEGYVTLK
jgi:hypothetical protein